MLKRLHVRNFTVFAEAEFEFSQGLNVIVGTNGTGKSHVLKLGYAVQYSMLEQIWDSLNGTTQMETFFRGHSATSDEKIKAAFQPVPPQASELVRRGSTKLEATIDVDMEYPSGQASSSIVISPTHVSEPELIWPGAAEGNKHFTIPVFIPAKEVMTMAWLVNLYNHREIPIDVTYIDLLRLLAVPPLRTPDPGVTEILDQLRKLIGGRIDEEGGRYYLSAPQQSRMEMNLVAEGFRKFATLYKLLANGALIKETTLFWDEPEANLNPALLRQLAALLVQLAGQGFQIILATHSLFLLKEFHILSREQATPVRYFGLSARPGEATTVTATDNLELLPDIVALDAELEQSDRFQQVLDRDDADGN